MRSYTIVVSAMLCLAAGRLPAQDTAAVASDSATASRIRRAQVAIRRVGARSLAVARRAERLVFDADSVAERVSLHDDPFSSALRKAGPVAFWVPIAAVAAEPLIWADEAQDRNWRNAQYAGGATAALALGFVVSRTTKHFVHRARPCTGASPDSIYLHRSADDLDCPRGSTVHGETSFFSEHAMALFAIASAASFQAQRQGARNAEAVTAFAFTGATVFSVGRIYQQDHWLSDVVVGAAVGTASGFLAAQLGPAAQRAR